MQLGLLAVDSVLTSNKPKNKSWFSTDKSNLPVKVSGEITRELVRFSQEFESNKMVTQQEIANTFDDNILLTPVSPNQQLHDFNNLQQPHFWTLLNSSLCYIRTQFAWTMNIGNSLARFRGFFVTHFCKSPFGPNMFPT